MLKRVLGALALLVTLALVGVAGLMIAFLAPDLSVEDLKPRWAGGASRFIDIDGTSVHVRDEGPTSDPVPIVLIHGTSASLHTWDDWAAALAAERRVLRLDLPGFGLTGPSARDDYRMSAYVASVIGVMEARGVTRAVLVGNSFGGQVAWETALAHPGRVAKLVLVDASGFPLQSTSVPLAFRLAGFPGLNRLMRNVLPRGLIDSSVRNVYGDQAKVSPELVERYYQLTRREGNRDALIKRWEQAPSVSDNLHRLGEIKSPTLILWGGKDRLVSPTNAGRFQAAIAGSRVVMFDHLGHVPHQEAPAETLAAFRRFDQETGQ
ncbi:MAG: alpha/beta fold hydrolase [Alphaproteobacteria bacterium]|nr:alpha/beta fold hydrolase [Alphaproteobacteria bacterium]